MAMIDTFPYKEKFDPHRYIFTATCIRCQQAREIEVPGKALWLYRQGALIQDAMPMVSINDREFLVSGICPSCWDKMFGEFK